MQTIIDTGKMDYRKISPPFELRGMPYYSNLVKLELIGQVPSLKCNNVKGIQIEYDSPYKTRQKIFMCALVSFFHGSMCSVLGYSALGQDEVAALALSEFIPSAGTQKIWFGETQ